jgi:hypothetical protein
MAGKSSRTNPQSKSQSKRKKKTGIKSFLAQHRYILVLIGLFIALIAAGGVYGYMHKKAHANQPDQQLVATSESTPISQEEIDRVFRNYLVKTMRQKTLASEDNYNDSGIKIHSMLAYDGVGKHVRGTATVDCTLTVNGQTVALNSSVQIEDAASYLRLNDISGQLEKTSGGSIYLSDAFAKAKGVWYKAPADAAMQAQLDSGVFVFNSGLVAPGRNAEDAVQFLINERAFGDYTANKIGNQYTYFISTYRQNYSGALKGAFPDLATPDDVVDTLFSDASDSKSSTLTLLQDGTVVKERTDENNMCRDMVRIYLGIDTTDLAPIVNGTSVPIAADKVKLTPVTYSRPLTEINKDVVLPQ